MAHQGKRKWIRLGEQKKKKNLTTSGGSEARRGTRKKRPPVAIGGGMRKLKERHISEGEREAHVR